MTTARLLDRRTFLADLGQGAFALAIVGIAGCSPSVVGSLAPTGVAGQLPTSAPGSGAAGTSSPTGGAATVAPSSLAPGRTWERVNLGFVSAYILIRNGEAALVDTGEAGSEAAIESSLTTIGLGWTNVGHVILTHSHGDHSGSRIAVLERAAGATGYAGAEDIPAMGGVALTAVGDGDRVFDLDIVTTPGHTAGSISVLDSVNGVLVAGDALGTADGKPVLPSSRFTADMDEATRSIVKLGNLTFETLLVGHGEPIQTGAAALVGELGASA